jgi:hypothetical protein
MAAVRRAVCPLFPSPCGQPVGRAVVGGRGVRPRGVPATSGRAAVRRPVSPARRRQGRVGARAKGPLHASVWNVLPQDACVKTRPRGVHQPGPLPRTSCQRRPEGVPDRLRCWWTVVTGPGRTGEQAAHTRAGHVAGVGWRIAWGQRVPTPLHRSLRSAGGRTVLYWPGCVPQIGPLWKASHGRGGLAGGCSLGAAPLACGWPLRFFLLEGDARYAALAPASRPALRAPQRRWVPALTPAPFAWASRRQQDEQKLQRPAAQRPGERSASFSPPPLRRPWEAQPPLRDAAAHSPQKNTSKEPTLSSLGREKFDKDGRPHCQTTGGF